MELRVEALDDGITYVTLSGAMDIDGASSIDANMSQVAARGRHVVVDMAHVDYIASFGIQTLLSTAHSVQKTGGVLVVANPQDVVEKNHAQHGRQRRHSRVPKPVRCAGCSAVHS